MKTTKLTWFDRLMVGITFAEAGVEEPVSQSEATKKDHQYGYSTELDELFEPGQDRTIPAHS